MLSDSEYKSLQERLEKQLKVKIRDKHIKAIKVNSSFHWQPPLYIEVDGWCANMEIDSPPEKIIAIFEHSSFLVITPDRGSKESSLPYFFGRQDIQEIIEQD